MDGHDEDITYKYWRQVTYLESIQSGMWVLMIELFLDGRHSIPADSYSSTIPVKKVLKTKLFFQLVSGYLSRDTGSKTAKYDLKENRSKYNL